MTATLQTASEKTRRRLLKRPGPIRVLQVVPDLGSGGAERMVVQLALGLKQHQVEVGCISLASWIIPDLETKLRQAGVPYWLLRKRGGPDFRIFPRLERVVREFRPDVIHTHQHALPYVMLARRAARAGVHTLHSCDNSPGMVSRFLYTLAFRFGTTPVAVAHAVSSRAEKAYALRTVPVIHNGIPLERFTRPEADPPDLRADLGFEPRHVLFTCVARLSPPKNQELLVSAFANPLVRDSEARLVLVGRGPNRESLERIAAGLGVLSRVKFCGFRTDTPEILAASDVFVLSSEWESNPLSVMEAMAAGKPVIATAVGGMGELVEDGTHGLLVPSGDSAAAARAIRLLADNGDLRRQMGRKAAACARSRFGLDRMVTDYIELYEELLR